MVLEPCQQTHESSYLALVFAKVITTERLPRAPETTRKNLFSQKMLMGTDPLQDLRGMAKDNVLVWPYVTALDAESVVSRNLFEGEIA